MSGEDMTPNEIMEALQGIRRQINQLKEARAESYKHIENIQVSISEHDKHCSELWQCLAIMAERAE